MKKNSEMYEINDFLRGFALYHVSHTLRKKGLKVDDITQRDELGNLTFFLKLLVLGVGCCDYSKKCMINT